MGEFTPTTDEVRAAASRGIGGDWFDRWLARHDAEKQAEALEEATAAIEVGNEAHPSRVYGRVLRARAAAIRVGAGL